MFKPVIKLFKALNSSGKSWQLSGAIVLAMFAGFLPVNSLLLLVILFIGLILNINFGIFLIFSVIFSGIGYLFDPMFESIGYSVLTNGGMNSFFTSLYNSAIFRWSAFNYTLVTGALVVSSVLTIPMMFILSKVVSTYRKQIGEKLNQWKLTKWMNLFNDEVVKTSVFRWWGLGVFGGLAAVIAVIFIFLFDPLARIAIEKGASYALKTEVNVQNFRSSFSDLKVEISGIEVADKDKLTHNLIQVKNLNFDLGFSALVEKKAFIQNLEINALAFNEKRKTPATAYSKSSSSKSSKKDAKKTKSSSKMDIKNPFTIPSVDDILKNEELKSVTEANKLKKDIEDTKAKWEKISKELTGKSEVAEIQADAKKLQDSLKGGDISKIASAKSDIDKLKSKIDKLKNKYTNLQKEFTADQKRIQKRIMALKDLPKQDIARLKKKYSLDASGGANIIGTLINDEVGQYVKMALKYYEMAKPYMKKAEDKDEQLAPPRGQGRWIKYANLSKIPDLVIQNARINVKLKDDTIDVKIKDFSSDQKLYQKPMTLKVNADGTRYKHILANVIDDRRTDTSLTSFDIKATGFKTPSMDMQSISMNDILTDASFNGKLENMIIDAKSDINVKQVKLQMPSQELINNLLSGINKFNINIKLNGDIQKPKISVKSDLDKQLSKGMSGMISKATKGFEKNLTSGIMGKASGSSSGLSSNLGDTGSLLKGKQNSLSGINTNFTSSSGGGGFLKKFF